ncbi:V-set domain-containing T-cell activation inhibitor 1 [Scleropages formosus]|uniref:V-set domain-containing T-cell activation inhibitor 1 n=1 Tax=Scleropages formosus TaxID=113540 RepID=UPI0010FA861A|nr:V-set domain-containing T-cell activation inhibitor 1-like [Scleropages formosus]
MAPCGPALLLLVFVSLLPCLHAGMIKLQCKNENVGIYRQNSLLSCSVKDFSPDVTVILVIWKKSGKSIFTFYAEKTTFEDEDPRLQFAEPNWTPNNMNISLLLKNTQIADAGQYECMVVTDAGEDKGQTSLQVRALYSKPTVCSFPEKNIEEHMKVTLYCNASGGYPPGRIQWLDKYNTDWTASSETRVVQEEDKRTTLISKFTVLQATSVNPWYKCVLYDSDGNRQGEAKYTLSFASKDHPPEKSTQRKNTVTITAVVVVLGSLACGLLVLLLLQRRRLRKMPYMEPCKMSAEEAKVKMDMGLQ